MKMKAKTFLTLCALSLGFFSTATVSQAKEDIQYREFVNSKGSKIQAVLMDKTDTHATLLLPNGRRAKIEINTLSEADQTYVKSWDKAKAYFLTKCRGLSIGSLLTLRGYEAIPIKYMNNSMLIDAKINDKPAKFIIDTGAGSSLFHTGAATRTGCPLGEFTEKVYGVSGEAPAAWAEVKKLQIGESIFTDRKILATDLSKDKPKGTKLRDDGLFGAELLKELDAVISYQERKLFLRPDKSDIGGDKSEEDLTFRLFKTKDKKTYRGTITKKTPTVITIKSTEGKTLQVPISRLLPADAEYAINWTEDGAYFLKHCRTLTLKELLQLREYQNFEYEREGNHIFVDGKLNGNVVKWMIDTGADNSLLHLGAAKKNNVDIGPMDKEVYGVGGKAPAAGCNVDSVEMGDAIFKKRKILATDLDRFEQGLSYVGLFGADFMRECNAVITYREQRIFLRQK